jgi:hypothetical protein
MMVVAAVMAFNMIKLGRVLENEADTQGNCLWNG